MRGFTNPLKTGGVLDVCLCLGCGGLGGLDGEWVGAWARVWRDGVVLCLCCCCCMPFSTILVVNPGSPGLESSVLVSS